MINKTGYTQLLRKLLLVSGPVSVSPDAESAGRAPTGFLLRPGIVLEQDRPEWFWLRDREFLASATVSVTSAAGTLPEAFLFNAAASGKLAIVVGIAWSVSVGAGVFRRYLNALPGGVATTLGFVRDLRQPPTVVGGFPQPAVTVLTAAKVAADGSGTDATFANAIASVNQATLLMPFQAIVLPPGFGVGLTGQAVGVQTLGVNFDWIERTLPLDESA